MEELYVMSGQPSLGLTYELMFYVTGWTNFFFYKNGENFAIKSYKKLSLDWLLNCPIMITLIAFFNHLMI